MSLFQFNMGDREREQPSRAKGAARFWEILARDHWHFFLAGSLVSISAMPFLIGLLLAIQTRALLAPLVLGAVGGMILSPQLCGLWDTIFRSFRDEPGIWWWKMYRQAWKRNLRPSLLPGGIFGALICLQAFMIVHLSGEEAGDLWMSIIMGGLLLLASMFVWPQLALVELPFWGILRNAVLFMLGWLPRTAAVLALWLGYCAAVFYLWPGFMVVLALGNVWLPILCSAFILYPKLNEVFRVEEAIRVMESKPESHNTELLENKKEEN